jgi:hypothetical protein
MRKRLILTIFTFSLACLLWGQKNPVDDLFNKYSEKEGFTSVYISGRMLTLFAGEDSKAKNPDNILFRLKSIRIMSENDSLSTGQYNFYTELNKKLDFSVYEELMVVKDGPEITKFLIKQSGNMISELLMITGGKSGNTLISIKGDFKLKELSELSKAVGIEELEPLKNVK